MKFYKWEAKYYYKPDSLQKKLGYEIHKNKFIYVDSKKELNKRIGKMEPKMKNDFTKINKEIGIFSKSSDSNYYLNMFYHIRCSIAHGRFYIKELKKEKDKMYYFENISKYKELGARLIIFEKTLLYVINTVTSKKNNSKKEKS